MISTIKGLVLAICAAGSAVSAGAEVAATEAEAPAVVCQDAMFEDRSFTYCEIDPARTTLRMFLYDEEGEPWAQFSRLGAALAAGEQRLIMAMNGGMYHPDRAPVGHYVEDGQQLRGVIRGASPGNFGLVPNGVFCIGEDRAEVIETERFVREAPDCRHATQSGPMLVIDGELHPRFLVDSTSRYIRNGVGSAQSGAHVVVAISNEPVTFHEFGRFFRDVLDVDQALFLDGNISRLHAPDFGRSDAGWAMGPILGVVVPMPTDGDDSADPPG